MPFFVRYPNGQNVEITPSQAPPNVDIRTYVLRPTDVHIFSDAVQKLKGVKEEDDKLDSTIYAVQRCKLIEGLWFYDDAEMLIGNDTDPFKLLNCVRMTKYPFLSEITVNTFQSNFTEKQDWTHIQINKTLTGFRQQHEFISYEHTKKGERLQIKAGIKDDFKLVQAGKYKLFARVSPAETPNININCRESDVPPDYTLVAECEKKDGKRLKVKLQLDVRKEIYYDLRRYYKHRFYPTIDYCVVFQEEIIDISSDDNVLSIHASDEEDEGYHMIMRALHGEDEPIDLDVSEPEPELPIGPQPLGEDDSTYYSSSSNDVDQGAQLVASDGSSSSSDDDQGAHIAGGDSSGDSSSDSEPDAEMSSPVKAAKQRQAEKMESKKNWKMILSKGSQVRRRELEIRSLRAERVPASADLEFRYNMFRIHYKNIYDALQFDPEVVDETKMCFDMYLLCLTKFLNCVCGMKKKVILAALDETRFYGIKEDKLKKQHYSVQQRYANEFNNTYHECVEKDFVPATVFVFSLYNPSIQMYLGIKNNSESTLIIISADEMRPVFQRKISSLFNTFTVTFQTIQFNYHESMFFNDEHSIPLYEPHIFVKCLMPFLGILIANNNFDVDKTLSELDMPYNDLNALVSVFVTSTWLEVNTKFNAYFTRHSSQALHFRARTDKKYMAHVQFNGVQDVFFPLNAFFYDTQDMYYQTLDNVRVLRFDTMRDLLQLLSVDLDDNVRYRLFVRRGTRTLHKPKIDRKVFTVSDQTNPFKFLTCSDIDKQYDYTETKYNLIDIVDFEIEHDEDLIDEVQPSFEHSEAGDTLAVKKGILYDLKNVQLPIGVSQTLMAQIEDKTVRIGTIKRKRQGYSIKLNEDDDLDVETEQKMFQYYKNRWRIRCKVYVVGSRGMKRSFAESETHLLLLLQ